MVLSKIYLNTTVSTSVCTTACLSVCLPARFSCNHLTCNNINLPNLFRIFLPLRLSSFSAVIVNGAYYTKNGELPRSEVRPGMVTQISAGADDMAVASGTAVRQVESVWIPLGTLEVLRTLSHCSAWKLLQILLTFLLSCRDWTRLEIFIY